jgi:membrane-associated phospholipid phosphatase
VILVLSLSCLVLGVLPPDVPPSEPASKADAGSDAPLVEPAEAGVTPPRLPSDTLAAGDVARFPEPVLPWPRTVPRVGGWDIAATGALGVATVVLQLTYTQPATPNWSGGILFDDWFRRVLRLSSDSARATAASVSDFLLYGLVTLPFLDAWLGAGVTYGRPDIALKLSLLDAEAMLSTTFITLGAQHLTLRARPFVSLCAHEPTARECTDGSAQDTSFPSGHTSIGFTVAMLECVNHAHLDVEHTGWNAIACPVSLATAGLTGILRIMADRHFASDVIVGGLIGAGIGYLVPTLHYAVASKNTTTAIIPVMAPGYAGLALAGGF